MPSQPSVTDLPSRDGQDAESRLRSALRRGRTRQERREIPADPQWVQDVCRALTDDRSAVVAPPEDLPFAPLAAYLLEAPLREVGSALSSHEHTRHDVPALSVQVGRPLWVQANDMLTRSVVLELHEARVGQNLVGDTAEARYEAFAAHFTDREWARTFFTKYPVLARQVSIAGSLWRDSVSTMLDRLTADLPAITSWLSWPAGLRRVTQIELGRGDRHRGGQSVSRVTFDGRSTLVYKPRPGELDAGFAALVDWVNRSGLQHDLPAAQTLVRNGYCWQPELKYSPSSLDPETVASFYYRQGALLAILHILNGNDIHSENVVCVGARPYLVDLESLCQPRLAFLDLRVTSSEQAIIDATTDSVLRIGLLPSETALAPGGATADLSGLGGRAGQQTPFKFPFVVDAGKDTMRVELRYGETGAELNQPVDGPVPDLLSLHIAKLTAGFNDAYDLALSNKDWLSTSADSPVEQLSNGEVRILARHTAYYGVLHMASFHPSLLTDALDREAHYDLLAREAENMPALDAFIEGERYDLWNNDFPAFTSPVSSTMIHDSRREAIDGLVVQDGLSRVRQRVKELTLADKAQQLWLIQQSVELARINSGHALTYPSYPVGEPSATASITDPQALVSAAEEIGERLKALAFPADDEIEWMGVSSHQGANWSLGALGPDLYHGLSGIALFFAALGQQTGKTSFSEVASQAATTARRQVARGMLNGTNGLSGLPGYLWADNWTRALLGAPTGTSDDAVLLQRVAAAIEEDEDWDVSGGIAGTLLCLTGLPADFPSELVDPLIERIGDRLLDSQDPATGGWLPRAFVESGLITAPLAGLAHGAAGISWALQRGGTVIGDNRFAEAVERANSYEDQLIDPVRRNWRDLRDPSITGTASDPNDPGVVAWCHGAAGIALARAMASRSTTTASSSVNRDVELGVTTTLRSSTGNNHSLCHGDLGNLDMVRSVAMKWGRSDWLAAADERLSTVVNAGLERGWSCGMPEGVETPGMLTGLAGIGYGLLRAASPATAPSVLTLANDQPHHGTP